MKINSSQLADVMVEVANQRFGSETFRRRQLMVATKEVVRQRGFWEPADDELSGSVDTKSRGLANIDYRFSDLKKRGTLVSSRRDCWQLASPKPPPITEFVLPPSDEDKIDEAEEVLRVMREQAVIVRKPELVRRIKRMYNYTCQICGTSIHLPGGKRYVEVHHVQPLGGEHNGPDGIENMLCVCPNDHVRLQGGAIRLQREDLTIAAQHHLDDRYINYHNEVIFKPLGGNAA